MSGNTAARPRSMKLWPPILTTFASGRIWMTGCVSSRPIWASSVGLTPTKAMVMRSNASLSTFVASQFLDTDASARRLRSLLVTPPRTERGLALGRELIHLRAQAPSDALFSCAQLLAFGPAGGAHAAFSSSPAAFSRARLRRLGRVPKLDGPVHPGRRQLPSTVREGHEVNPAPVSGQLGDFFASRDVPDAHDIVEARRCQHPAVRRERTETSPARVAFERLELLARADFPQLHVLARARGSEQRAVRSQRHRMDRPGVHIDGGNLFARGRVPQLDRSVDAAGSEGAAVGRIGQRLDA